MIAVMNDMYVIDGYHNIYPTRYKIKFRKIIEKELVKILKLKIIMIIGEQSLCFREDPKI